MKRSITPARGGLYAEMIQNRDFEANTIPPGWHIDDDTVTNPQGWKTKKWFDSDLPEAGRWFSEGDADGSIRQDSKLPLNENNPHSMCLTVTKTGERRLRCGQQRIFAGDERAGRPMV